MAEGFIRFSHLGLTLQQLQDRTSAKKINAAIQKLMEDIWRRSATVFIEHLSENVLVETGETYGSLIGAGLGQIDLSLSLPRTRLRKRPQLDPSTGKPIPGTLRSLSSGIDRGKDTLKFSFTINNYAFFFDFNVFQFALHDAGAGANGPTSARGAAERARQAAEHFARKTFQDEVGQLVCNWLLSGTTKSIGI
jgi:hypothetical protein